MRETGASIPGGIGCVIVLAFYLVAMIAFSIIYAMITGWDPPHQTSVLFTFITLLAPGGLYMTWCMWFPGLSNVLHVALSFRTRLLYTLSWFAPSAMWAISEGLLRIGYVRTALAFYDFRYVSFFLMVLLISVISFQSWIKPELRDDITLQESDSP